MYVWGGPGIHAFNFVLLVGMSFGTYSSIAVAAPLADGLQEGHGIKGRCGLVPAATDHPDARAATPPPESPPV